MLKGELRKDVLRSRNALTPVEVAGKSARVMERLLEMDEYRRASTMMAYLDFRNEVQTGELVQKAIATGKRVAVPVTDIVNHRLPPLLANFPNDSTRYLGDSGAKAGMFPARWSWRNWTW